MATCNLIGSQDACDVHKSCILTAQYTPSLRRDGAARLLRSLVDVMYSGSSKTVNMIPVVIVPALILFIQVAMVFSKYRF